MLSKRKAPRVNRAKIIATLGPASTSRTILSQLVGRGVDGFWIKWRQENPDETLFLLARVRETARELKKPLAIIFEPHETKLTLGTLPAAGIFLAKGALVNLQAGEVYTQKNILPVRYLALAAELRKDDWVILGEGVAVLKVLGRAGQQIHARVMVEGKVRTGQTLLVPGRMLKGEDLNEAEEAALALAIRQGADFVVAPPVQKVAELAAFREKVKRYQLAGQRLPGIIARIEKEQAIQQCRQVAALADGILVHPGLSDWRDKLGATDLGNKKTFLSFSGLAEQVAQGVVEGVPVIMSEEGLGEDVIKTTRADAVLLQNKTEFGRDPVGAVGKLARYLSQAKQPPLTQIMPGEEATAEEVPLAMAAAAVKLARQIGAAALLTTTQSGYSAREVVKFRPDIRLVAATPSPQAYNRLNISWGVTPLLIDSEKPPEMVQQAVGEVMERGWANPDDQLVVVSGLKQHDQYDSMIRVVEVV